MTMKKLFITLALMLPLFGGMIAMAQNTNNDSLAVLGDSTQVDEVEAFSDTTQTDTSGVVSVTHVGMNPDDIAEFKDFITMMKSLGDEALGPMLFALIVLLILFVIAPAVIIGLILYFIFRNRRERMRLAEMAMKNGQPIPEEARETPRRAVEEKDEVWQRGVRQSFFGVGLIVLLGMMIGKVGVGVGLLVLCIGLGNLFIARKEKAERNLHKDVTIIKEEEL